jgi:hypothetical protein
MSEEKESQPVDTKSLSMWFVNEDTWEYNDESYYQSGGYNTVGVFTDIKVAQKFADKIAIQNWKRGIEELIYDTDHYEVSFKNYCDDEDIDCHSETSGNTYSDFIKGKSRDMTETQIISVLKKMGLSFAHVSAQVIQVCLDETETNGGFCATMNGKLEHLVRESMHECFPTNQSDKIIISKISRNVAVSTCKCDGCGYDNPLGSTTCRLCNCEISIEG